MRRPTCSRPNFGTLAGLARVGLGLWLGLAASCGVIDSEASLTAEPDEGEASNALAGDDGAMESVCTQGRYRCFAKVAGTDRRFRAFADVPSGFGPQDLQSAYNIVPDKVVGSRPTVAIVGAYGYAAIESDLAAYRSFYKLPPCTKANGCLKVVNQEGQLAPLPPNPPPDDDWTVEAALDMDMVSAACPLCNILIVQADDNGAGLFFGQRAAVALGATVISNSWGAPETADTSAAELAFTEQFFANANVATFASAGDDGYNDGGEGPDYPATSAGVISVGGTRLVRDPALPRGWRETAWTRGGSACSFAVPKPAYQTQSPCKFKATSDIAAVGDPMTGVAVYNAANSGWITVGGTSASAPFVAAIFAAAGHGAQRSGAFIASQVSKLHDVTIGTNGSCAAEGNLLCNATTGWDGPTGYGTPNAAALAGITVKDEVDETDEESGGCAATGNAGAGALLGLALVGLGRRRRRR